VIPANDVLQPMPPRVRGERSTETPRTQAAIDRTGSLCPRGLGRSPGPADGRAGIGSEPEFERELCEPRYSVSPFLMLGPFPLSPPFRATRPPEVSEAREARGQPDPTVER